MEVGSANVQAPVSDQNSQASQDPLDNPVWHALNSQLERFAQRSSDGRAVRFMPDVSVFWAVDRIDGQSWRALARLAGPGGMSLLFRRELPAAPEGWTELFRLQCYQMIADDLPDLTSPPELAGLDVATLGTADVDDMLALVKLTDPGPFLPRTLELGTYIGVRSEGRLIAMAGQRLQLPGFCEVSAVCVHPDARRQGLGAALTLWMLRQIHDQGDLAFLHVLNTNDKALALYKALGFKVRCTIDVAGHRWLSAPDGS